VYLSRKSPSPLDLERTEFSLPPANESQTTLNQLRHVASLWETFHAQAEQMKVFVGELETLIGSGKKTSKSRNSTKDSVVFAAKAQPFRPANEQPAITTREKAQPAAGHVIPFDDDFSEFDEF